MAIKFQTLTGDIRIDADRYFTSWSGEIHYGFTTSFLDYATPNYTPNSVDGRYQFAPLTEQQKLFCRNVFANFNEFSKIKATENMQISSEIEGIRLANSSIVDSYSEGGASGLAYPPSGSIEDGNVFFRIAALSSPQNEFINNYFHEIGHSLGLKHPTQIYTSGIYGLIAPKVDVNSDFVGRTVMGFGLFDAITFLPNDIIALQYNYGVDVETRNTSTLYSFSRSDEKFTVSAEGKDLMQFTDRQGGTIWDAGGDDTLNFSQISFGVRVDLNPGMGAILGESHLLDAFGSLRKEGFHIYLPYEPGDFPNALFENAVGGAGNDIMTGNRAANALSGGGGNDTLTGGAGIDTAILSGASRNYSLSLNGDGTYTITDLRGVGFDGVDRLKDMEFLQFSDGRFLISAMPTDLSPSAPALSNTGFAENLASGSLIGLLSSTDPEGQTVTFSIGTVKDANGNVLPSGLFRIVNNSLVTNRVFDFEVEQSFSVELIARDPSGHETSAFVSVSVENQPDLLPTAPTLSNSVFTENLSVGSVIGILSASDPDSPALTFSIGTVKDANGAVVSNDIFRVVGTSLVTNTVFDFETQKSFYVELTSHDPEGHETSVIVTLSVQDRVDVLNGTIRNDVLTGGSGVDQINGNGGNDRLMGEAGSDVLKGGGGADKLIGGLGADYLYGGKDADRFIFKSITESTVAANGRDTIFDFLASQGDKIDLSVIDANSKVSGNQSFSFIGNKGFSGKDGELRVVKQASDTYVYADVNGDKKADFSIHFDDALTMTKDLFIL